MVGRESRQLQRPGIVPGPVEVVGVHVVLLRQLQLAGARAPTSRARGPPARSRGRDRPPRPASRRWRPTCRAPAPPAPFGAARGRELAPRARRARCVSSACSVQNVDRARARIASTSSRPSSSGISSASSSSARENSSSSASASAATQADPAAVLVGVRELERARVEVVRLLHGQRGARAVAGRDAGTRSARAGSPPSRQWCARTQASSVGIGHRRLDHPRRRRVQLPPERAGQRRVGDVADQHVLERELHVALDLALRNVAARGRAPRGPRATSSTSSSSPMPLQHAAPERLPDHGGVQQRGPRVGRERVDPRRDRGPHRGGQLAAAGLVADRRHQLLEEQRVPLRRRDDLRDRRRVGSREQRADDLGRLAAVSGSSGSVVWPIMPAPHVGRASRNSGRASARNATGWSRDVGDQVVDQVQQRVVRPMHVLEHEQQRTPLRQELHDAARREQQVDRLRRRLADAQTRAAARGSAWRPATSPFGEERADERPRASAGPRRRRRSRRCPRRGAAIWPNARYGVCSSYGRLRPHSARSPRSSIIGGDLLRQPRLADPRGPEHRDEVRRPRADGAVPDACGSAAARGRARRAACVDVGRSAGATSERSTSHAGTGSRLPFASTASSSR